jgi:hypothetical protein
MQVSQLILNYNSAKRVSQSTNIYLNMGKFTYTVAKNIEFAQSGNLQSA